MTGVHVVVPEGVDDPERPSGGNVYDRRLCSGLAADGWTIHEHVVGGSTSCLAHAMARVPDGATVVVDGLLASTAPKVLVPASRRVRLVVLLHVLLAELDPAPAHDRCEAAVLSAAAAVVTTSGWTRTRLLERYAVDPARVHVAEPGVDAVDHRQLAPGTSGGGELLVVAAVVPAKGHADLVAALALLADLPWRCTWVGTLAREPALVETLGEAARRAGIASRIDVVGVRTGAALEASYAAADLLVLPTRCESYGMVVAEGLAHGLPVVATEVGGVPSTVGRLPDGRRPGLLVPPADPDRLAAALRGWLEDPSLRAGLRQAARDRRRTLTGWPGTVDRFARVLTEVAS